MAQTDSVSNDSSSASVSNENVSPVSKPQERTFTQNEVNEQIARVKSETYERAKRENLPEKQNNYNQTDYSNQKSNSNSQESINIEKIRELAKEEASKNLLETINSANSTRMANEFVNKLESAKDRYPDFESVVEGLQLQNMPHLVRLANEMDNTADIIYDLGQDPLKVGNLMMLARENPELAKRQIKKLSDSIRQNQEASNKRKPNEPLHRTTPSNFGVSSGPVSVLNASKSKYKF